MGRLNGKIALVSGGNSGIGLAAARQFAQECAFVYVTGRRTAKLEAAVASISTNASGIAGDVAKAVVFLASDDASYVTGAELFVDSGMESMDHAPYLVARGRWSYGIGDGALYDSVLRDGLNNAASAVEPADAAYADRRGLKATARLVSYGIAAVEPGLFGLGPAPAVKLALQRAGWSADAVERVEIDEAFAAIAIVVARELGFANDIVNVEGGAVAHGHPIGAAGAVLTTKLIHSMRRDGLTRGVVTLCIGGGQGIALAIEVLHLTRSDGGNPKGVRHEPYRER